MTIEVPITWVEVFADVPRGGNLLPVLHDADAIPAETMQALAARFQQSETSYLCAATDPSGTYRHRIFTVENELPFAGHPSLGAAAAWARRRREATAEVTQETGAGLQRLSVVLDGSDDGRIGEVALRVAPAEFGEEVASEAILAALGLPASAAVEDLPAQMVGTGLMTLIVPVSSASLLADVVLDGDALAEALAPVSDPRVPTCYLVGEDSPGRWRARSFVLEVPGMEDAATGSAAGPLGAYLRQRRGIEQVAIDQGVEMGSPSCLRVDSSDGVVVRGTCRIVSEGTYLVEP